MAHHRNRTKNTDRNTRVKARGGRRQGAAMSPIPGSTDRAGMVARVTGNHAMQERLRSSVSRRDQILTFIMDRLRHIHRSQQVEMDALDHKQEWWRRAAWGHQGFTMPEPTRWHPCARAYKQAALALSRGDLGRGARLLEQALELERVARRSTPEFLADHIEATAPAQGPAASIDALDGEGCPITPLPPGVRLADRILAVQTEQDQFKVPRPRLPHHWWTEEEDDEEDQPADGDGGGS